MPAVEECFGSDNASGKSSVLESFSELPFPRDSGLCTRFATQITFRRTLATTIKVSIIPGPDRNAQEARKLQGYVKEGLARLTSDAFLEILTEVRLFHAVFTSVSILIRQV